jgi:MraZ protein
MALTGTYDRNLDEKRRMAIPKRLLDDFGIENLTSLYIAPGTEKSLALYSPQGFDRLARKIARKGTTQTDVRTYVRLFYSRAERVEIDAQSRIRIPDRLADFAGLQRDVMLLGVNDHAEVWDVARWTEFNAAQSAAFDEMADRAFEGL